MTYANALKRTAEQAGNHSPEGPNGDSGQHGSEEEDSSEIALPWPLGTFSGPIKGFCSDRVMENLDPLVRSAWELEVQEAVFVHYLDGGYNLDIAQNVHTIAEDLKSKHHPSSQPLGHDSPP